MALPAVQLGLVTPPLALAALLGALAAGAAAGLAVSLWPRQPTWEDWLTRRHRHRRTPPSRSRQGDRLRQRLPQAPLEQLARRLMPGGLRSWLQLQLLRAGQGIPPEQLVAEQLLILLAAAAVLALLVAFALVPPPMAIMMMAFPPGLAAARIATSARARRRSTLAQLPFLVDLMALEQSGGGVGARRAMELVVARAKGEAAAILRECLTRSAASGTPPLDAQLERVAELMRLPAMAALAAVIRMQRLEGIATSSPLGGLARGLRDRQRDELTTQGRRALVAMLVPVAVCILLPFILIVLYPALDRLAAAL